MKKNGLLFLMFILGSTLQAQIGIGIKVPHESAALDIRYTNKGVLLARIALTGTTDTTTIVEPANSLLVYNTATISDVIPGYYYWNASNGKWIRLADSNSEGWGLNGNEGTDSFTNYIGTTDDEDILFRRNKVQIGRLAKSNISFGDQALSKLTSGTGNVSMGANTLARTTNGVNNTAVGHYALNLNTTSYNTAVGSSALGSVITGDANTAVGNYSATNLSTGRMNVSLGHNSMYSASTASANTAVGSYAMYHTKSGTNNTIVGYDALSSNISGNTNSALGNRALFNLKSTTAYMADNNTAVGNNAGMDLIQGSNNVFLGADTKPGNTSGSNQLNIGNSIYGINLNRGDEVTASIGINVPIPDNSAVLELSATNKGFLPPRIALKSTTDEVTIESPAIGLLVYNTALLGTGTTAVNPGYYYWNGIQWNGLASSENTWNTSGNSGTSAITHFIGTTDNVDVVFKRGNLHAGLLTEQTFNTSFGVKAYKGTPMGSYEGRWNTAIGYNSLHGNEDGIVRGHDNVAVGANSLAVNDAGQKNVAVGSGALTLNTNGWSNVATGFQSLRSNVSGSSNVASGYNAMFENKVGNFNVALGDSALIKNIEGSQNTAVGSNSLLLNEKGSSNTAIGCGALFYNKNGRFNIAIGDNTGPAAGKDNLENTTAIGYSVRVNFSNSIVLGNSWINSISGQVNFSATSDRRFKENIKTIPLGLDFINKLHPVEYVRKNNESKTKEWGVIAQELEQTLQEVNYKEAGIVQNDGTADKILSVRYNDLIAPLIKSVQELAVMNKELAQRNSEMEERIKVLERK